MRDKRSDGMAQGVFHFADLRHTFSCNICEFVPESCPPEYLNRSGTQRNNALVVPFGLAAPVSLDSSGYQESVTGSALKQDGQIPVPTVKQVSHDTVVCKTVLLQCKGLSALFVPFVY